MCKRVVCWAMVCALGLPAAASAGLVGWWKLDEGSGETAADATGNGQTGALIGGPTWVAGRLGGALRFAGGGQKVDIPYSARLNPPEFFSLSIWANPAPGGTSHRSPLTSRDDAPQRGYIIYVEPGNTWQFWTGTGTAWNTTTGPPARLGEWTHVAATYARGEKRFYINGNLVGQSTAVMSPNTQRVLRLGGGASEGTGNYFWVGMIDEAQVFDRVLSPGQVKDLSAGKPANFQKADGPNPADKATAVSQALLQWTKGDTAVLHNVYLGTSPELTPAELVGPGLPFTMYFHTAGLVPGTTYYWRVDTVEADGKTVHTGDVWTFTATPAAAWAQKPADGATYLPAATTLEWRTGMNAVTHTVYLSADRAAVESGAAAAKVADKQATTTFAAANLERGKTYYWRVDEHLVSGAVVPGPVWSFTLRPVLEKADPSLLAWWKFDEEVSPFVADHSGNDYYGTLVGNPQRVQGYFGGALQFNGLTDYVDCGTPAALYLPTNYTYSLWFKMGRNINGDSGTQFLLCIGQRSDLVFGVADGVGVNGDLSLHYYDTAPGFRAVGVGRTVWSADEWHMVTATRDAAGHKIYLDGELKNSDTNARNDNYATTRMISLGSRGWTAPSSFFHGTMDDVRIYNRALTADEIRQLLRGDLRLAWGPQPPSGAGLDIRDATALTWSAGDGAARHDVYFGRDRAAVNAADASSPWYRGRQTAASFSLSGLVELGGGTYYWRIDEVAADGTTVHKGNVWSFTVPGYLIVDEFETYTDDEGKRIYETWIDGWTNGTGSTVGNLLAPFAERTIVHGGRQAMPVDYNNVKSPFYSEAERVFSPLQDWTVGAVTDLSLWFRGRPAQPAVVEAPPGQYKIGAASNDIWGTADSFRFFYKTLNGDGAITAKVISLTGTTTNWAKAAVMIRENLDPGSTYASMFPTPDRRRAFQNRPVAGGTAFSAHSAAGAFTALPFWVRIERKGSMITGYYSTDGTTWTRQSDTENTAADRSLNPVTISMADRVLIGLAVASNNFGAAACVAEFSDVTTTGAVSGSWQLVNVGINYGNDPDKLYLAVEDSTGKSALVTHPDPAAVGLTAWTEWKIPLDSLTGVNLARVRKLTLGVGDKKAPVKGGAGRIYLDDIVLTKAGK
ncbi:MAG: LamG domain-containing protein [Planctomycetes bacterium]|nr:LamG domain-containing protein [Planctomycetota bacterium]